MNKEFFFAAVCYFSMYYARSSETLVFKFLLKFFQSLAKLEILHFQLYVQRVLEAIFRGLGSVCDVIWQLFFHFNSNYW